MSDFATMAPITATEASKLYDAQNNAGNGYSLGDDDATVADAAAHADGEVILRARTTSDVYAVRADDGARIILIGGDGMGCSPWAVDVTADMLAELRA